MILWALDAKFGEDWMKFVGVVKKKKKKSENICVGGNGCGLFGQIGVEN